jgi:hypothetical protein
MRWLMDIPHSTYKITIMGMGEKLLLQIEDGSLVQIYKFKTPEEKKDAEEVKSVVTESFLNQIKLTFASMHASRGACFEAKEDDQEFSFPQII